MIPRWSEDPKTGDMPSAGAAHPPRDDNADGVT